VGVAVRGEGTAGETHLLKEEQQKAFVKKFPFLSEVPHIPLHAFNASEPA
jgi:hypothetical protein